MTNEKEKAIETVKTGLGFEVDASEFETNAGFETIGNDEKAVPFLKILQKGSPQVEKEGDAYIEGAEPGLLFNNATNEIIGKEAKIIILSFEHLWIEWIPEEKGGGFVGSHSKENADRLAVDKADFKNWKTADGNELQESYLYYVLIEGRENEGVLILSLTSSNIKIGKMINRQLTSTVMDDGKIAPGHFIVWALSTEFAKKDTYSWYRLTAKRDGFIKSKEQYLTIKREKAATKSIDDIAPQIEGTDKKQLADAPF